MRLIKAVFNTHDHPLCPALFSNSKHSEANYDTEYLAFQATPQRPFNLGCFNLVPSNICFQISFKMYNDSLQSWLGVQLLKAVVSCFFFFNFLIQIDIKVLLGECAQLIVTIVHLSLTVTILSRDH